MITHSLIYALCLWSINQAGIESHHSKRYWRYEAPRALNVCRKVGSRALKYKLDPLEVIAVSYVETRHNEKLVSRAGAVGAMQALPKYWKRKKDKDTLEAGLRAWKYYRKKSSSIRESAGKYNGAGENSRYANDVEKHYQGLLAVRNIARFPL
jgi:hypothetical protein